jgi:hypothetical protein
MLIIGLKLLESSRLPAATSTTDGIELKPVLGTDANIRRVNSQRYRRNRSMTRRRISQGRCLEEGFTQPFQPR